MKQEGQHVPPPQPETIAFHEAGHAVAAVAVRRRFTRLSIVPVNGEPTGCKWAAGTVDEWVWIICALSGARAQVQFCPRSLPPEKLRVFQKTLILPRHEWCIFSYTGWFSGNQEKPMDLDPVLSLVQRPNWPVPGLINVSIADLVSAVDETLKTFFQRPSVAEAVSFVAETLLKRPVISDGQLFDLVVQIQRRLVSDDYWAVLPDCVREKND